MHQRVTRWLLNFAVLLALSPLVFGQSAAPAVKPTPRASDGRPGQELIRLVGFSFRFFGLKLLHLMSPSGDFPPGCGNSFPTALPPVFTGTIAVHL